MWQWMSSMGGTPSCKLLHFHIFVLNSFLHHQEVEYYWRMMSALESFEWERSLKRSQVPAVANYVSQWTLVPEGGCLLFSDKIYWQTMCVLETTPAWCGDWLLYTLLIFLYHPCVCRYLILITLCKTWSLYRTFKSPVRSSSSLSVSKTTFWVNSPNCQKMPSTPSPTEALVMIMKQKFSG